ncbi:MAG: SpoIIE family protein phosphatase [Bacteroidales bacterium]|nr:SpoIIE family protein phosphatase [Bacteroidales bacterium]
MKIKITEGIRKGARAGFLLVLVATLTLELTGLIQYYYSAKGIREEAQKRAESQLETNRTRIMDVVNQTEAAVRNSVWIAQWCLDVPDSLHRVAQRIVEDNPLVIGSTVALVPGYNKRRPLYSPYVCKGPAGLEFKSLATEEYDYPSQEWFSKPLELEQGYWSEPYIDDGGGEVLMTTYSYPIRDKKGQVAAILTADISLDWLTELVGNVKVYPSAFSMVVSRAGQIMVCPVETLIMRTSVTDAVKGMDDSVSLASLNRAMLSGESGNMTIREKGVTSRVFFAPVERTGWSMSIIIPETEIYAGIRKIGQLVMLLQLLGILMIIFIIRYVIMNYISFDKMNKQKERIQNELQVASDIQMAMVPKIFPPFPKRDDLDLSASIVPAKEVGGDLYDFFIRDEKLHFCIGDVSGKGVPASLLMAVTRTQYRTLAAHYDSPAKIVSSINDSMDEINENNMFVTFFCGVLDLKTGHMDYCNAGHNAPYILTDAIRELAVEPNLPLGVLPGINYVEQSVEMKYDDALFLFTDGLNEAENIRHEQFGESGIRAVLHTRRSAQGQMDAMKAAVAAFVGEAEPSDDLTMLFLHYLGK